MPIPFNSIPADIRLPFAWTEFDNSRAVSGPSTLKHRIIIFGQTLATDGLVTSEGLDFLTSNGSTYVTAEGRSVEFNKLYQVTSADKAGSLTGKGSMIHNMAAAMFDDKSFTREVWVCPQPEPDSGTAATYTITINSKATKSGTWSLMIAGTPVPVSVGSGDSAEVIATNVAAAVNKKTMLPVFASSTAEVVTLSSKWAGSTGNNLDVRSNYYVGEELPNDLAYTFAQVTEGAGVVDIAPALAAIGDQQFTEWAVGYDDSAVLSAVDRELSNRWGALYPYDGVAVSTHNGTFDENIELANSMNSQFVVLYPRENRPEPAYITTADIVARASKALQQDAGRPLQTIGLQLSKAPNINDRFSINERMSLVDAGMSTLVYGNDNTTRIETSITTYKFNDADADDSSYGQWNNIAVLSYLRYDWNNRITLKYPRFKLADDGNRYSAEQPIMTPKTMKAEAVAWARDMETIGMIENVKLFKENLVVERNASNRNRLDVLLPPDIINQLISVGTLIQFRE